MGCSRLAAGDYVVPDVHTFLALVSPSAYGLQWTLEVQALALLEGFPSTSSA